MVVLLTTFTSHGAGSSRPPKPLCNELTLRLKIFRRASDFHAHDASGVVPMAETGIFTGVIEEISGGAVVATGMHHFSSVDFIRIAGKRIRNIRFDSYIGTAVNSAFENSEEISIALFKGNIVSIKKANGEVSRALQGTFGAFISNGLKIFIPGFVIALITFAQIAGNTESVLNGAIPGLAVLAATIYLTISRTNKHSSMRNSFGSDS